MNGQHLRAFLWLRWRLRVNQLKRGGIANAVILAVLAAAALLFALFLLVASLLAGVLVFPEASPAVLMYVWDAVVVVFLLWWCIGIVTDLQRSEALALDKFLHLPVSLTSAFLINYLSSLLSLNMIVFLPAMVGLCLGMGFAKGPALLLLFPLLAAFLLLVTALTYQFQGWLASLMANKRRRRTIIVMISMSMILLCQLPNLVNVLRPWENRRTDEGAARQTEESAKLQQAFDANQAIIAGLQQQLEQLKKKYPDDRAARQSAEYAKLQQALAATQVTIADLQKRFEQQKRNVEARKENERQVLHQVEQAAWWINVVLPIGWLPLGAMELAEGNVLPALFGTLGLTLLGAASLWRAYRTTVRLYTGQFSSGRKLPVAAAAPAPGAASPAYFLEKKLPWVSEPAAAIALGSFRSLLRAPEAKMMLLSPLIMVVVFGSMFLSKTMDPPASVRPLLPFGAMAMVLLGMVQLVGNQFGFDRSGFRVYVLCPARRRDILLGKNLAVAPLALGMGAVMFLVLEALYPLPLDYLLAIPFQFVSMYLLFCLIANWLSILAPVAIASGSLRAGRPRGLSLLLNFAFVFLFPLALVPTLLPLGLEMLLQGMGFMAWAPIYLVLTLLECAGIGLVYRLVLTWQGSLLQAREQKILELVAAKAE